MAENGLIRLCGLWAHTSRAGQTYLTGKLNFGTRLVAFRNTRKVESSSTECDWHLFLREDRPAEDEGSST